MLASTIKEKFITFFAERGHQHFPAVPIVNKEDPTLLFINAGMNPFKDVLLGHREPPHSRVVTVQPCLRVSGKHNDLEEVGVDTYHHTMFEMLGNWSFGDYFKEEAIQWAWELLTGAYHLPPDRLYVTVFNGDTQDGLAIDEESVDIVRRYVAEDRICRCTKKDNFWEMGNVGPCGPSVEIHMDIRSEEERQKKDGKSLVNKGHPQVIELWNLVFIQFQRMQDGTLQPLPTPHVDTGMGLERMAMVLQAKQSNYDTDIFMLLMDTIAGAARKVYGQKEQVDVAMRVIADHVRAVTFAIADGQPPPTLRQGM